MTTDIGLSKCKNIEFDFEQVTWNLDLLVHRNRVCNVLKCPGQCPTCLSVCKGVIDRYTKRAHACDVTGTRRTRDCKTAVIEWIFIPIRLLGEKLLGLRVQLGGPARGGARGALPAHHEFWN
jgi:hypothetical protein